MDALAFLEGKLETARRVLDELLEAYDQLTDTVRMEKSNQVMDELNSYLRIKENLFLPYIECSEGAVDMIARICPTHADIEYIVEHMIQIHVDEPGFEYYNRLAQLQRHLAQVALEDEQMLFPWLREHLSDADREYIAVRLRNQTTHESLAPRY